MTNLPRNFLLSRLSRADQDLLRPDLQPIALPKRLRLYAADEAIEHVYFPTAGITSLISPLIDGARLEVGMVGREGMLGVPVVLNRNVAPTDAEIQVQGEGFRMALAPFRRALAASPSLLAIMLRYVSTFLNQVTQTASCNGHHLVEERLARWLLMIRDRTDSDVLRLTHEYIATMLGVRRAGVTVAAGTLAKAGLIRYQSGVVTILDRAGLEEVACECYAVERRRFDAAFDDLAAPTDEHR